jgi:hypothetical protein
VNPRVVADYFYAHETVLHFEQFLAGQTEDFIRNDVLGAAVVTECLHTKHV